ncbi:hypothetical protein A8F94_12910 [Bacillus sp. FJAT-27225]|uniref:hypothetical protein n=1 Tax=Bacillus sp. FJAT-27225 TaxID=1743144 RepID=UPI00080C3211|nr:hypothetical protein [Bacillus sp. FJAT-27225]OCA85767.1 hypothetical protein A8F94_12910 [Bacillus sp. FJAT-27225]
MVVVHFYDNKNVVLTQYLNQVPAEGSDIRIKGRSGKVTSVQTDDNRIYNVQVEFQAIVKKQVAALAQNKKRR